MVYLHSICPIYKRNSIQLYEKTKRDIINPFYFGCNNKGCKIKSSIRKYSFLNYAKRIPGSIIHDIIMKFIIEKKSAKEIEIALKTKYKQIPNYLTILKILRNFRSCIAEFLKYQYKINK